MIVVHKKTLKKKKKKMVYVCEVCLKEYDNFFDLHKDVQKHYNELYKQVYE